MQIKSRLRSSLPRAARVAAPAVVGLSLLGFAVPPASATDTYTATAKSSGLVINLFGTQMTGGTALASVDSGAPSALAEGVGTLTPGMVEDQKVSANQNTPTPTALGKACAQGGGAPSSSPIGIELGLACSSASASITDPGPSAAATGEIANLDVNLSPVLDQVLAGGANQLFSGLQQILGQLNGSPLGTGSTACPDPALGAASSGSASSSTATHSASTGSSTASSSPSVPVPNPLTALAGTASVPGSPLNTLLDSLGLGSSTAASTPGPLGDLLQGLCQTLTNIENVVKNHTTNTLVVDIGPASASVIPGKGTSTATADGATAEVQILPGIGCAATLAECIANASGNAAPLIDIKVAPAHASSIWNGSKWAPSSKGSLATVDLNIPGFAHTIDIPGGASQTLLPGTPLETVIDLGSATTDTTGQGASANGATLDVAKNTQGGILLDLGSTSVTPTATAAPETVSTSQKPAAVPPVVAASHSPVAAPPAMAPIAGPTLVHTGAWWSGSLPYLAGLAALGGGLLGWPRLRRSGKGLGMLLRAARR